MSLQPGASASVDARQAAAVNTKIRPSHCYRLLHVWWADTLLHPSSLCHGDITAVQKPHR